MNYTSNSYDTLMKTILPNARRNVILNLITDTKGMSMFTYVKLYFANNNIPLHNIAACATD